MTPQPTPDELLLKRQIESRDGTHRFSSPDWRIRQTVQRIYKNNPDQLLNENPNSTLNQALNLLRDKDLKLLTRQLESREKNYFFACPDWRIKSTLDHLNPENNTAEVNSTQNFYTTCPEKTYDIFKRCQKLKIETPVITDGLKYFTDEAARIATENFHKWSGKKELPEKSLEYIANYLTGTKEFDSFYENRSQDEKIKLFDKIPEEKQAQAFSNISDGQKKALYARLPTDKQKYLRENLGSHALLALFKQFKDSEKSLFFSTLLPEKQCDFVNTLTSNYLSYHDKYKPEWEERTEVVESLVSSLNSKNEQEKTELFQRLSQKSQGFFIYSLKNSEKLSWYLKSHEGNQSTIFNDWLSSDSQANLISQLPDESLCLLLSAQKSYPILRDKLSENQILNLFPKMQEPRQLDFFHDKKSLQADLFKSLKVDAQVSLFLKLDVSEQIAPFLSLPYKRQIELFNKLDQSKKIELFKALPDAASQVPFFRRLTDPDKKIFFTSLKSLDQLLLFNNISQNEKDTLLENQSLPASITFFYAFSSLPIASLDLTLLKGFHSELQEIDPQVALTCGELIHSLLGEKATYVSIHKLLLLIKQVNLPSIILKEDSPQETKGKFYAAIEKTIDDLLLENRKEDLLFVAKNTLGFMSSLQTEAGDSLIKLAGSITTLLQIEWSQELSSIEKQLQPFFDLELPMQEKLFSLLPQAAQIHFLTQLEEAAQVDFFYSLSEDAALTLFPKLDQALQVKFFIPLKPNEQGEFLEKLLDASNFKASASTAFFGLLPMDLQVSLFLELEIFEQKPLFLSLPSEMQIALFKNLEEPKKIALFKALPTSESRLPLFYTLSKEEKKIFFASLEGGVSQLFLFASIPLDERDALLSGMPQPASIAFFHAITKFSEAIITPKLLKELHSALRDIDSEVALTYSELIHSLLGEKASFRDIHATLAFIRLTHIQGATKDEFFEDLISRMNTFTTQAALNFKARKEALHLAHQILEHQNVLKLKDNSPLVKEAVGTILWLEGTKSDKYYVHARLIYVRLQETPIKDSIKPVPVDLLEPPFTVPLELDLEGLQEGLKKVQSQKMTPEQFQNWVTEVNKTREPGSPLLGPRIFINLLGNLQNRLQSKDPRDLELEVQVEKLIDCLTSNDPTKSYSAVLMKKTFQEATPSEFLLQQKLYEIAAAIIKERNTLLPEETVSPQENLIMTRLCLIENCIMGQKEGIYVCHNALKASEDMNTTSLLAGVKETENYLAHAVTKAIDSVFTRPDKILKMLGITDKAASINTVHQSNYMRAIFTLIYEDCGLDYPIEIDPYGGTVPSQLLTTKKNAIFETVFYQLTQHLIKELREDINLRLSEKNKKFYNDISTFLGEHKVDLSKAWTLKENGDVELSEFGAIALLVKGGYLHAELQNYEKYLSTQSSLEETEEKLLALRSLDAQEVSPEKILEAEDLMNKLQKEWGKAAQARAPDVEAKKEAYTQAKESHNQLLERNKRAKEISAAIRPLVLQKGVLENQLSTLKKSATEELVPPPIPVIIDQLIAPGGLPADIQYLESLWEAAQAKAARAEGESAIALEEEAQKCKDQFESAQQIFYNGLVA